MCAPLTIVETTSRLAAPTQAERDWLRARVGDAAVHAEALATLPALNAVEVRPPSHTARTAPPPHRLRVAAWNVERGRYPDEAARLLAATGADVVLLTEVDDGMARTEQRHTTADLADRLEGGYAFGVEFVELGTGSAADQHQGGFDAGTNERGLHGNAIVSRVELRRPAVGRLSDDIAWFSEDRGEPRVGGRMAVVATVPLGSGTGELVVAAVHLESSSSPELRRHQFVRLLDALDTYAGDRPVVIGGDLNTCSSSPDELRQPGVWDRLLDEDPSRYVEPVPHEPLFAAAAARGYQWEQANEPGATTRFWSGSRRWKYAMRLDWILTRAVACRDPRTFAAVADGDLDRPLSDHDLLAVTVEPT